MFQHIVDVGKIVLDVCDPCIVGKMYMDPP